MLTSPRSSFASPAKCKQSTCTASTCGQEYQPARNNNRWLARAVGEPKHNSSCRILRPFNATIITALQPKTFSATFPNGSVTGSVLAAFHFKLLYRTLQSFIHSCASLYQCIIHRLHIFTHSVSIFSITPPSVPPGPGCPTLERTLSGASHFHQSSTVAPAQAQAELPCDGNYWRNDGWVREDCPLEHRCLLPDFPIWVQYSTVHIWAFEGNLRHFRLPVSDEMRGCLCYVAFLV